MSAIDPSQPQPLQELPPWAKRVFVPCEFLAWPQLTIASQGKITQPHLNEFFSFKNATGFYVAYDSLEDMEKDFPGAKYSTVVVFIRPPDPETARVEIE